MPFDPTRAIIQEGFTSTETALEEDQFNPSRATLFDEPIKDQFNPSRAALFDEATEGRSLLEIGGDIGVGLASGVNSVLKLSGDLYGLTPKSMLAQWGLIAAAINSKSDNPIPVPDAIINHIAGDPLDNIASRTGKGGAQYWNDRKTPQLKKLEADRSEKVKAADGQIAKAGVAFWETISSPSLLTSFMAEQIPMLLPVAASGRAAGLFAKTLGASEATIAKASVAGAVGGGALMTSADAGSKAYDQLLAIPDEVWRTNDEYQKLIARGATPDESKKIIALDLSQDAAIAAGIVSGITNLLPGARILERSLVKVKLPGASRMNNIVKGFAGEAIQEGLEEAATAISANIATQQIDVEKDIMQGVGEAFGMGAAAGPFGAIAGARIQPTTTKTKSQQLFEEIQNDIVDIDQATTVDDATTIASDILNEELSKKDLVSPLEKTVVIEGLPETERTQLETETLEAQTTKLKETKIEDLTDSEIRTEIDNIVGTGSSRIAPAEKGEAQRILPDERDFTTEESARLDSLVKEENIRREKEEQAVTLAEEKIKPLEPTVEKPFKESIEDFALSEKHRESVKKALDEGRTVPEEILRKYPDLIAPAEPVAAKIEPEKPITPELEPIAPEIEPITKEVLPPTEKPTIPEERIVAGQKIPEGFKTTGDKFEVGQRAIKLKDGTVVFDDSPLHALQINKLKAAGIDISEIESGGFIKADGSYIKGSADTPGIIAKEMAQKKAELAKKANVFIDKEVEVKEKKQQLSDIYNVNVTSKEVGSLTSTTNTIANEQDLANLVMDVSQKAQELFLAVVTDSKGKILRVIKHTSGLKASSSVDPITVAAEVASIDNAKFVHFTHNHPGGTLRPSIADIEITKDLVGWLDGTGIEFGNHVITSPGGKAINFNVYSGTKGSLPVIEGVRPPKDKAIKIPYTERFIDEGSVKGKAITNPDEGLKVVKSIQSDNAILLLSHGHEPLGVVSFEGVDMKQLRQKGGVNRILKAINATNASAVMIKTESKEGAINVINFLNRDGGVRVLDWMHKNDKGILVSASSAGDSIVRTKGEFFSQSLTGKKTTYTKESTEKAIATPMSKINKALGIKVSIISFNEIPSLVKKDVTAGKRPKAYTEGNNIFLIHDSIENDKDALITLAHELKGHVGTDGIIGKDNWSKVIPLYRELKKTGGDRFNTIKAELDKRYGDLNEESELKEFIAIAAEHREKEGSIGKFMRKVREFFNAGLRAIGISKPIGMSDIDIILTRSEQFLKVGAVPLSEITLTREVKRKDGTIQTASVKADTVLRRTRKKRDMALNLLRCVNG